MRPSFHAGLAALLAAWLLPLACAGAQTVSLSHGGEEVTIAVGDAAALPPDFPEDVFVPTAARLVRVEDPGNGRLVLEFLIAADAASVADAYAGAMGGLGWARAAVAPLPGGHVQAWEKQARAVLFAAVPGQDGTRLHLQLLPRARPARARADR